MTETITTAEAVENGAEADGKQQEQTFTAADVEKIVRDRLTQQAKNKFGDYDELKARAEGAKTLEDRVGTLEGELNATRAQALRTRVAADFGISTKKGANDEPSDADLFLTGTDEATLTAQAQRLAARQADSKKQGNVAPREGDTKSTGKPEEVEAREFVGSLFGGSD